MAGPTPPAERRLKWVPLSDAMRGEEGVAYRSEVLGGLSETLKAARERKQAPLGLAAAVGGLRRNELWQFEEGKRGISAVSALALAAFYGVSLDGLADCKLFWDREGEDPAHECDVDGSCDACRTYGSCSVCGCPCGADGCEEA